MTVKKSYTDGHIAVGLVLKTQGWHSDSISVTATTDLTIQQAREFAASLLAKADAQEARVKAKQQAKERRGRWREREIAAGRMVVMDASAFSARRS